jgi:membrane fusion protein, type I secretion system
MTDRPGLLPALGGLSTLDSDAEPSLRGTVLAGLVTIAACFGGFVGWSLLADLDSAVIASGFAVVDSHRKTVQHLEGGILHELLVREGDVVRAGQPLAILDTTQADAQLGQLTSQLITVEARLARLRAEQQGLRAVEFPSSLTEQRDVELVSEALETQRKLFEARWRAYDSSIGIIRKRIQQYTEQIASSQSQAVAVEKRLDLMEEDLKNVAFLYERGYERRPRMLELQRNVQELRGQQAQLRGAIAAAQQSIAGAEMEIVNLGDARQAEVAKELQDLRAQQADLADRIRAARDIRERQQIISPQDGVVTDLRLVTPGGVIGSGQPLMDIVPVDDELIIETRIHPDDIDVVHPGLPAQVRLTAFKRSTTPTIEGEVTYVSADMLTDPRNGETYFLSRVTPSPQSLSRWQKQLTITPGMPAEVMIATGERRAFEYFLTPFKERMTHASREE